MTYGSLAGHSISSLYELFQCFSYCYFLVVHLQHHHLITTFELSCILTNTINLLNLSGNAVFSIFTTEINIFNKLLLFAWHDIIAFFVLKVLLNTNKTTVTF